jgi:hypothetical protein
MAKKNESGLVGFDTSLNSKQIKELIGHFVHTNKLLQSSGKPPVAFSIVGAAGISKTSIVEQKAKELGIQFVKKDLGQIEELGDLVGMPVKEFEIYKMTMEGGEPVRVKNSEKWVTENTLPIYLTAGYIQSGRRRTGTAKPAWVEGLGEDGVLLIDDATRAGNQFLTAIMELIRVQTYDSWSLPKGWTVILTENPDDGSYNVNTIDSAQRSRFIQFQMKFDVDSWAEWAESVRMDTRCISYVLLQRDLILTAMNNPEQKLNARSLTNFFNAISSIKDFNQKESLSLINTIGQGSVGQTISQNFVAEFINKGADKMITPHQMLHDDSDKVFKRLDELIRPGKDNERPDIAAMLIFRIGNYLISMCERGEPIGKAINQRIIEIMESSIFGMDHKLRIFKGVVFHDKYGDRFMEARTHKSIMEIAA